MLVLGGVDMVKKVEWWWSKRECVWFSSSMIPILFVLNWEYGVSLWNRIHRAFLSFVLH